MALILLFFLLLVFVLTAKRPVIFQWLLLILLIDPTGHITRYFNKTYSWGIEQSDIIIVLIIISYFIVGNRKLSDFFSSRHASTIFKILFIFFIYRIVVYGYIIPPVSSIEEYLRYFIIRERTPMISFFIIIPAYLIALKDLRTFFRLFIILGTFGVVFFMVSVLTGIEIVPFSTLQRYQTGNILRQFMYSYSAPTVLIVLSIVIYISKIEIKYKKLLYLGAIFSILAILISLTKGLYLSLVAVVFFSAFFTSRVLRISISKGVQRVAILGFVALITLNLLMPSYFGFSKRLFNELYTLGTTGSYKGGEKEGRLEVVLPAQLYMIKQRPLFGTGIYGYKESNLSPKYDVTAYDSTDMPITGSLMQYGIVGMLIYYFFYYKLFKVIRKLYLLIKSKDRNNMINTYKYEFIMSLTIISLYISGFINFIGITGELVSGGFITYIYVGIILACLERFLKAEIPETENTILVNSPEK